MLKSVIKKIGFYCIDPWYRGIFNSYLRSSRGKELWLVDIDNTIADSAITFKQQWSSEKERLLAIQPLEGMRNKLLAAGENTCIIYISARNYLHAGVTKQWLIANGFPGNGDNLVIVPGAADKLPYLQKAVDQHQVVFFDDLTYNHESDELKFYTPIIEAVRQMKLQYVDYHQLQQINKN
jgi:hypothetical protein